MDFFFDFLKSGVREEKRPVSEQSGFCKFFGLPDQTWCPVEPYSKVNLMSVKRQYTSQF